MSNKTIGPTGLTYLWGKIKDYVSNNSGQIPEVNHGTSDTTFTLTPNVMHIWGTVSSLTLSLPTDSNQLLDEFMFTFTSGSTPTTLSLPSTVKWVQDIEVEANKTYQVSIINNLAGWLTNGMPSGGGSGGGGENNVIESISVNGVAQTVQSKNVDLLFKTINNESISGTGNISISGGGGEANVIESISVNSVAQTVTNKNVNITVPTKVSDITNDSGFITGYTETDPIFTASAAHGITSSDISNWNSKTSNVGTITGINMNGASKGTSGVVDLGTVITAHQDISGKADKSEMSVVAGTGTNADKTTITLKTGTSATVLTAHQDISGKADSATTLAGYGITDAYTKDESNSHFCSLDRDSSSVNVINATSEAPVDLNDYKNPGTYVNSDLNTYQYVSNLPSDFTSVLMISSKPTFRLYVFKEYTSNYFRQRIQNTRARYCNAWERIYNGSSWESWYPVQDDLTYKPNIYTGSSAPSSSTGSNGDIYIQTS